MHEAGVAIVIRAGVIAGVLFVVFVFLVSLVFLLCRPWWPSLIFQTGQQPQVYVPWLVGTFVLSALIGYALFGSAGLALTTLLWFVCAPAIVVPRATRRVWNRDSEDDRKAALAIRNRIQATAGEPELGGDTFWSQYVLDRARAERQAQYRPPGI